MYLKRISDQSGRGSARKAVYNDDSLAIAARIPGLVAAINPATLANESIGTWAGPPFDCVQGRDLLRGLPLASSTPVSLKINSDPAFNGKPVLDLDSYTSDVRLCGLGSYPAFTWTFVASIDPTRLATTNVVGVMICTWYDSDVFSFLRWENASRRFRVTPDENVSQNVKFTANNSVPDDGLPHVYTLSYNGSNTMSLYIDGAQVYTNSTFISPPLDDPTATLFIGNTYGSLSAGHVGSFGKLFFFNEAIDITQPVLLANLHAALINEYV